MQREYTAVFKKSGKWIIAWIEEVPGANTQGKTMKEARSNLREALSLILESNREAARRSRPLRRENFRINVPALA